MKTKTRYNTQVYIRGRYSPSHFLIDVISRNGSYSSIVATEDLALDEGALKEAKNRFPFKGKEVKLEAQEMVIRKDVSEKIKKKLAKKKLAKKKKVTHIRGKR